MVNEERNSGKFRGAIRERPAAGAPNSLVTKTEGVLGDIPRGRGRVVADGRM